MNEKEAIKIYRWYYLKPNLIPDKNGDIVIIHKGSFFPLEYYEWGITNDKQLLNAINGAKKIFMKT